jgi:hypothetical protein
MWRSQVRMFQSHVDIVFICELVGVNGVNFSCFACKYACQKFIPCIVALFSGIIWCKSTSRVYTVWRHPSGSKLDGVPHSAQILNQKNELLMRRHQLMSFSSVTTRYPNSLSNSFFKWVDNYSRRWWPSRSAGRSPIFQINLTDAWAFGGEDLGDGRPWLSLRANWRGNLHVGSSLISDMHRYQSLGSLSQIRYLFDRKFFSRLVIMGILNLLAKAAKFGPLINLGYAVYQGSLYFAG